MILFEVTLEMSKQRVVYYLEYIVKNIQRCQDPELMGIGETQLEQLASTIATTDSWATDPNYTPDSFLEISKL